MKQRIDPLTRWFERWWKRRVVYVSTLFPIVIVLIATVFLLDLSMGSTYIPQMNILSNSIEALSIIPVVSALLGPVVGLAAAKAAISHFRYHIRATRELSVTDWISIAVSWSET